MEGREKDQGKGGGREKRGRKRTREQLYNVADGKT